ncbi:MAG: RnfABCDGE type electron transport complex subunit A [Candidatus Marinimicrobia bacterium]|mgnify:FL=1|jgi:electron transport complex protein RnfA|nr:RnfABCDGE type electron transport complex subunit A [Candidatus Neomarinimicrobiota bacterium]MBT3575703.1 RnfABCDGE type electron transport complex subunit A [Candidatus Neomarinimicrobiota bacterium]MBT3679139.1 RnfABCDGE type electron transport complex subunit A [Candidatus Neomarinimicrobiota bacterium]MBT3949782.1 RnfABCDGE type electron transport complex subunit A [Candidatus Neomarinimicrobiota bacterium]MBT4251991.1 RnfABCDGE type electron transport complex subunit A [Candidatus Neom
MSYFLIFFSAAIVNNFVLSYFLGICPFVGVSKRVSSAVSMGMAVTFVMLITAVVTWLIYHLILVPFDIVILQYVSFILVIASLVQLVEMFIRKVSKSLYDTLGIFLPLITTNCAILGLALFSVLRDYSFMESVVFGLGAGAGFTLALVIMAGIREELELAPVPKYFQGAAITMIVAGGLALAFMGFAGMI